MEKEFFPLLPKTSTRRHTFRGEHLYFRKNEDLLRKYNDKFNSINMHKKMNNKFLLNNQSVLMNDFQYEKPPCKKMWKVTNEKGVEQEEDISLDEWEGIEEKQIQSYFSDARAWIMKCVYE